MRASQSMMALAIFAPLASATTRFLVLWEQDNDLAGQNDLPLWRIDTGDIDLCGTADDCDWGDAEMKDSSFLYNSDPSWAKIDSKCDTPDIDIYHEDDDVHRAYLSGGDGTIIGTCDYSTDSTCNDEQTGGSVDRKVVLVCDLEV